MADKEIAMLPGSSGVTDDTIIPVYQPGATEPAQSMTGAQFRKWAEDSVQPQVEAAEAAAKEAEKIAETINLEAVYEELALKGDNLEQDPDTGLLYLTAYGNRVSTGIKIETSDRGNAAALNYIYEILRRGVFTEDVSFLMAALKQAIESGDSGGTEPDDGPVVGTRYYIKQNLTNVTSSNATISVSEGAAYTTTLTAVDGYNLSAVSVTMGGVDVTASAYSNGVISIVSVTGNIVITAVAVKAPELVTETLEPFWSKDFNNTTFEYTVITSDSSAKVYAQSVYFRSTVGGGTLYVTVDPAYLSYARFRVFFYDSDGNPYKKLAMAGSSESHVSGDLSYLALVEPGGNAYIYATGSWSFNIPDECTIMLDCAGIGNNNIVDETIASASKPIYAMIDAITFNGVGVTAKVVKEV